LLHEGHVLRAIIPSVHKFALRRGTSSVLSFASVHKFALHEGPSSVLISHLFIKLRYEGRPCYHSHLFTNLRYTKGVPPCYHSHLFIKLRYTKGVVPPSFASVHKFALHEGARPSVLSFASVQLLLHEGHVPPCYRHLFIGCVTRASSVLSFASVHNLRYERGVPPLLSFCSSSLRFTKGHVPPAIIRICSRLRYTKGRPSVLSFASVHNLRYTKGHVPPCYHSHLFIKFALHEASLRAIIRICS
jgi:hypothetical protein